MKIAKCHGKNEVALHYDLSELSEMAELFANHVNVFELEPVFRHFSQQNHYVLSSIMHDLSLKVSVDSKVTGRSGKRNFDERVSACRR